PPSKWRKRFLPIASTCSSRRPFSRGASCFTAARGCGVSTSSSSPTSTCSRRAARWSASPSGMPTGYARSPHGPQQVVLEVVGDLLAERRSLNVGGPEVNATPDARVDDLLEGLREALERPRGAGARARRAEAELVRAEEVLQGVNDRTAQARM